MHDETNGPKSDANKAGSLGCFPWQAREASAAAKTRRHSTHQQWGQIDQDSSYIVLATPLKSEVSPLLTSHQQPMRPWPLSVSCMPAQDTTMQHDHVLYAYTSSYKLLLFQFILFCFRWTRHSVVRTGTAWWASNPTRTRELSTNLPSLVVAEVNTTPNGIFQSPTQHKNKAASSSVSKKKIIMYPSCMASLHMSRLSRTHDQYSLLILLPSPNSRLPSLVYYAIRLMNSMCL